MKNIFYTGIFLCAVIQTQVAFWVDTLSQDDLKSGITPIGASNVITSGETWEGLLDAVLAFVRDSMFSLLLLIAVWMFLFIWGKLLMARWNPEELKKAMTSLLYAGIWLFAVAAAFAMVRFIAWIKIL